VGRSVSPSSFAIALLFGGCFSDPPPADDAGSSDETTNGETTSSSSTDDTANTATLTSGDNTSGSSPDSSGTSPSTDDTSSTGSAETCGNGIFEIGELCLDDEPEFDLFLGAPIRGIALGGIDDELGDGAIVGAEGGGTWTNWWLWDGGPAGPQVQGGILVPVVAEPVMVAMGDIDGAVGSEIVFGSRSQLMSLSPLLEDLVVQCALDPQFGDFTLAQIDASAGMEIVVAHREDPFGVTAWTAPGGACTFSSDTFPQKTALVAALERADGPDEIALSGNGTLLAIGLVALDPFDFDGTNTHDVGESVLQMRAGDFDGDGLRDDLAIATEEGIAMLLRNDDETSQSDFVAAGGMVVDLASGDLDGDGDDDLAIADSTSSIITLLVSDGGSTFAYLAGPETDTSNTAVALADVNGDVAVDLVVGNDDGDVRWYLADP
jgi:hypothetical protein